MLSVKKRYRVEAVCVFAGNPYPIGAVIESPESDEVECLIEAGAISKITVDKAPAENKAATGPKQSKANG